MAKSIFDEILEFAEQKETPKEMRERKGGKARATSLTPEERKTNA